MKTEPHKYSRGFTLAELALVMGVIGFLLAGVWIYGGAGRQSQHIQSSLQDIILTAESVRNMYMSTSGIKGNIPYLMPGLTQAGAIPLTLIRPTTSTCGGVTANFADTPWSPTPINVCGSFRICAWNYGVDTGPCSTADTAPAVYQYFAIEFTQLDYGSCMSLAEGISPYQLTGLKDVYINGTGIVNDLGGALPVPPSLAAGAKGCTPGVNTNTLDFIYTIRTPLS